MSRAPSTPPDLPGYDFVKVLGSGGFSDVFLYEQHLPRRKVAVKVLLTDELTPATRSQFVAEANVMAQLSTHPYIVTIYHADVASDDRPYFVMEYCSGSSLAQRYKQAPFAVADALRTGVRLSSAIATAHGAGILHRDIKPANVLGNDFGWPALTDFGISSTLEEELPLHTTTLTPGESEATSGATGSNASVGLSVPWSPPEMFEDDPQPDVRSDLFSLAATVWTLLAGRTPFEVPGRSNGTLDLIGRIERGAITPLTRDDVPRSLLAVLQKGMATKRSDRFATVLDFARALQRVELELGYAATTIDVPNLGVEAAVKPESSNGADETRARSVSVVQAQPAPVRRPEPPAQRPVSAATELRAPIKEVPATEPTVRRSIVTPTDATAASDDAEQSAAESESAPSKNRRAGLVAALVAAALAVAVALGVLAVTLLPQSGAELPDETTKATGGGLHVTVVPAPVTDGVVRNADGTATFRWKNPSPEEGDQFQWRREGSNDPATVTSKGEAVIPLAASQDACIEVSIIRSGRTSANPAKVCSS